MTSISFPNESVAYREARGKLLAAEIELRRQIESVAALRRDLPPGGEVSEDYVFEELVDGQVREVRFSELFQPGHAELFVYSFMYSPTMDQPCPMCTAMLDGLDGQIPHLNQQISTAIVARHDIGAIHEFASARGWQHFRLLSSKNNSYNPDYSGESDGSQLPFANVFERDLGGASESSPASHQASNQIRHFWGTEVFGEPADKDQHMRHVDSIWPLWSLLDMTRAGRGDNWVPALAYA